MLNLVRYAIHSSLTIDNTIATSMLLLNGKGLSAGAEASIMRVRPGLCFHRHYSQASVTYRQQEFWIESITAPLCDLLVHIKWNEEAQHILLERKPGYP